jgi:CDP-glycerol glycerophosphotransferase (TagB/SpsB family)
MINIILPENNECYDKLLRLLSNPVIEHLPQESYMVTSSSQENCINVHFFCEKYYFSKVGRNGVSVFLAHGLSDKNYRVIGKKDFHYAIVPGELWKLKYIQEYGFDEDQVFIGGYPKFDDYFNSNITINNDKPNIVWCPTHNMFLDHIPKVSSYPFFREYISQIPDKYNFIESLHPANSPDHNASFDTLINADVVIGGFSGAIYEALILGKPVVFLDWLVKEYIMTRFRNTFEYYIYKNQIGYHAKNIDDVLNMIEQALKYGIKPESQEFIDGIYSPELRGTSGKVIAEFLMNLSEELKYEI